MASVGEALSLDVAPPKPWRRFIPSWLRSLIWMDSVQKYDAFLSYSWKSDSRVAPAIQSLIQQFQRPWYKLTRPKTVFRDLSCLPAGSNLEAELHDRLDRSTHLIVLASPEAASSSGMEMEAKYWFSRPRDGEVLVVISSGDYNTWEEIREHLLPPTVRDNLESVPVWASVQDHRARIIAKPLDHQLRGELIEDLKQVLLRFYPDRDWGQLRGAERRQRQHFIWFLSAVGLTFLVLFLVASILAIFANRQRLVALSRESAAKAETLLASGKRAEALNAAISAFVIAATSEARDAIARSFPQELT